MKVHGSVALDILDTEEPLKLIQKLASHFY